MSSPGDSDASRSMKTNGTNSSSKKLVQEHGEKIKSRHTSIGTLFMSMISLFGYTCLLVCAELLHE